MRQKWGKYVGAEEVDSSDDSKTAKPEINVAEAIEDAYLRTLSRRPSESEVSTATEFVAQAKDQLDGLRGVMWALLNTKEFIVNH